MRKAAQSASRVLPLAVEKSSKSPCTCSLALLRPLRPGRKALSTTAATSAVASTSKTTLEDLQPARAEVLPGQHDHGFPSMQWDAYSREDQSALTPHSARIWDAISISVRFNRPDQLAYKHRLCIEAISEYTESGLFDLDAHCAAVIALTTEPFESDPAHYLLTDLWADLAQRHVFDIRCVQVARSMIDFYCRRDLLRGMERASHEEERRTNAMVSSVERCIDETEVSRDESDITAREAILQGEGDPLSSALDILHFLMANGFNLRHDQERVFTSLMRSAAARSRMDVFEDIFEHHRRNNIAVDHIAHFRIAECCWRAKNLPGAEANQKAFEDRAKRGDFGDLPSPFKPKDGALPHELKIAAEEYRRSLRSVRSADRTALRAQDSIDALLLRTNIDAGRTKQAERIFRESTHGYLAPSELMVRYYIAATMASGKHTWRDALQMTQDNFRLRFVRYEPRFWHGLMDEAARLDELNFRADALLHIFRLQLSQHSHLIFRARARSFGTVIDNLLACAVQAETIEQARSRVGLAYQLFKEVDSGFHLAYQGREHDTTYAQQLPFDSVRRVVGMLARQGRWKRAWYVAVAWSAGTKRDDSSRKHSRSLLLLALGEGVVPARETKPKVEQVTMIFEALQGLDLAVTEGVVELALARADEATDEQAAQLRSLLQALRIEPPEARAKPRRRLDGADFALELRKSRDGDFDV